MTQPDPTQNTFNISNSPITNVAGSGDIHYSEASEKRAEREPEGDRPKRIILFLAANPLSTQPLRLDEEIRDIEAGLQRSKHRDRFSIQQHWALRPRDLQRAMLDNDPYIVHFAGHGVGDSTRQPTQSDTRQRDISFADDKSVPVEGIILEGPAGQPQLVSTEALAALFALFADSVGCVVLNACYSERQARAIAQHVPYVIGMNQAIGDRAAIEFAVGFYDALGAGDTLERAYKLGCVALQLAGISEHLTPTLITKTH